MAKNKQQKKKARERRVAQEKIADQKRAKQQKDKKTQNTGSRANKLMAAVAVQKTNYVAPDIKGTFARRRSVG
jgi:hypothetical protein